MQTKQSKRKQDGEKRRPKEVVNQMIENDLFRRVSYDEYRDKIQSVYDGPKGALLAACSKLSLHEPLGERLLKERKFDLAGAQEILDVGSGAGQIAKNVLKYADPDANVTCIDLSVPMLKRARLRMRSHRPRFIAADITKLPFPDGVFDCVTCGYVLEHVPDPRDGLEEISRVMKPGGRMMLLTTEDSFSGAWTSRFWCCRTYNREELLETCGDVGLDWNKNLWFTKMHEMLRAGGICIELIKRRSE